MGANIHDNDMPSGWHTIKSVLLDEMCTAATFHHISKAADALFHARLIGERIAKEPRRLCQENKAAPRAEGQV